MKDKRLLYVLIFIILLGFSLRLFHLSYEPVWTDEAISVYESQLPIKEIVALNEPTPPLYYILLHFWIGLFGYSEFSIRFLSLIFGTLLVYVIYLLASRIFDKESGLYAAALAALSSMLIYFSQEARSYSLLFLLSALSMYAYVNLIFGFSKKNMVAYILSTTLLLYSHQYAIFIVVAQNIHFFYLMFSQKEKKMIHWLLLQSALFLVYVPWLVKLKKILEISAYNWINSPNLTNIIDLYFNLFSGELKSFLGWMQVILFTVLVIYAFVFSKRTKLDISKKILFLSWILSPFIIPFLFSLFIFPIFLIKYSFLIAIPIIILVGHSINTLPKKYVKYLMVFILTFSVFILHMHYTTPAKDPWDKVSSYLKSNVAQDERIGVLAFYETEPLLYYYNSSCMANPYMYTCGHLNGIYDIRSNKTLRFIEGNSFWLVLSKEDYGDGNQDIIYQIDKKYNKTIIVEFKGRYNTIKVYRYNQFSNKTSD